MVLIKRKFFSTTPFAGNLYCILLSNQKGKKGTFYSETKHKVQRTKQEVKNCLASDLKKNQFYFRL